MYPENQAMQDTKPLVLKDVFDFVDAFCILMALPSGIEPLSPP
jgi:hypothetical protein